METDYRQKAIEEEFERLLFRYKGLIRYLMSTYNVPRSFEDDYRQEIHINLWKAYQKDRHHIQNISGWIGEISKRSIFAYRRFFTKKSSAMIVFTDKDYLFEVSDEEYSEPRIDSLKMAICSLDEEDQAVIRMVLNGDSLPAKAMSMGLHRDFFHRKTSKIYSEIRSSAHRFFERVPSRVKEKRKSRPHTEGWKKLMSKPVDQFDRQGNFIKRWESTADAGRGLEIQQGNISRAANGDTCSAGGYHWKYAESPVVELNVDGRMLQIAL